MILGRFTTETHAMALYISTDTPPLFTPRPGTFPYGLFAEAKLHTCKRRAEYYVVSLRVVVATAGRRIATPY
ncbi:hypothetical protein L840_2074 [Mycobacterium sp. MAC_011194_8550]|nr:hypothetical protein L839_0148 [Mycobacterium avium MAV_120809_2495]ETZ60132.1 hypothetical protein L840_2074 [Mycobacterium sp. MAC_011194_8550]